MRFQRCSRPHSRSIARSASAGRPGAGQSRRHQPAWSESITRHRSAGQAHPGVQNAQRGRPRWALFFGSGDNVWGGLMPPGRRPELAQEKGGSDPVAGPVRGGPPSRGRLCLGRCLIPYESTKALRCSCHCNLPLRKSQVENRPAREVGPVLARSQLPFKGLCTGDPHRLQASPS